MSEQQAIDEFLASSTLGRLQLVRDASKSRPIKAYLGEDAFAEYELMADSILSAHLARAPRNVLFIPGIMGSSLRSLALGSIWWLDPRTRHRLNDLELDAQGQNDISEDFRLDPCSIDVTYEGFLAALIQRNDFDHDLFPYDWRKSLLTSAPYLRQKICEMYDTNRNIRVHVVAHSMGGLLLRATLMLYEEELAYKLGKIVFLGTPHYGSPAISAYLKNHLWGFGLMSLLGIYLSRKTFRSLTGAIGLLPAPVGIYPGTEQNRSGSSQEEYAHPCSNFNTYNASSWNLGLNENEAQQLQIRLDKAYELYSSLKRHHNEDLSADITQNMLVIAGVGINTLSRLEYYGRPWGAWESTQKLFTSHGDGSVPLPSASLELIGDTRYIHASHGSLPNIPAVYKDIFAWLNGESLDLQTSPQGALEPHLSRSSSFTSATPNLDGSIGSMNSGSGWLNRWQDEESYIEELHVLRDCRILCVSGYR